MAEPLCIPDSDSPSSADTAGRPAIEEECLIVVAQAERAVNADPKTSSKHTKAGRSDDSKVPEDYHPADLTLNPVPHFTISTIQPSLLPYVAPFSPVNTDQLPPTVVVLPTTTTTTTALATPHSPVPVHTTRGSSSSSTTTHQSLLPTSSTTESATSYPLQITTGGILTILPLQTTFLVVTTQASETQTITKTVVVESLDSVPTDTNNGNPSLFDDTSSTTAGGGGGHVKSSNLLVVGGSTVLAGAIITAGIFLLVRYAMKVKRRRRWASEDAEKQQQAERKVDNEEKQAATIATTTAAQMAWGQAGAHCAGFV